MANKTVPQLILATRQHSNTVRRQVVTDDEVLARINDGIGNLYDLIDGAHGTFFVTPYPFTLVGGYGQNAAELPADCYHVKALDRFLGASPGPRIDVPTAASYAERNNLSRRSYDVVAGTVVVAPPQLAAGNYELQYIPKAPVLSDVVTVETEYTTVEIARSGSDAVDGTLHAWHFDNGAFDASYVGRYLAITGAANAGNNGLFLITAVADAQNLTTVTDGGSELFGPDVTAAVYTGPLDSVTTGASTSWVFNGADFDDIAVGGTIVVAGSEGADGTYTISGGGAHTVFTTTGPASSEAFLAGVTVTYQPPGTVYSVPAFLNDWILFAELDAAITILDKQNLDSLALQRRRAQQEKRIQAAARARRDQPYQVPRRPRRSRGCW